MTSPFSLSAWQNAPVAPAVNPADIVAAGALIKVDVPAAFDAAGNVGEYAIGGGYFYLVMATNSWARTPVGLWS